MRRPVHPPRHCVEGNGGQGGRSKSHLCRPEGTQVWGTRGNWTKPGLHGRRTAQDSGKLFLQWWNITEGISKSIPKCITKSISKGIPKCITKDAKSSISSGTTVNSTRTRSAAVISSTSSPSSTRARMSNLRGERASSHEAGTVWHRSCYV